MQGAGATAGKPAGFDTQASLAAAREGRTCEESDVTGFIVRIELHGEDADYEELYKWMQQEGFTRAITGGKKKPYKLPSGTYYGENDLDAKALRDHLRDDVPWCGSTARPWVLVTAFEQIAWALDPLT